MNDLRECPIEGCTSQHKRNLLMCKPHWRLVPRELQGPVYRTARVMWDKGTPESIEAWREAADAAIAAVEQKEAERVRDVPVEDEPPDKMGALGDEMAECLEGHDGVKAIIMLHEGNDGGVTLRGFEDETEMLSSLQQHFEALAKAYGRQVRFVHVDDPANQ